MRALGIIGCCAQLAVLATADWGRPLQAAEQPAAGKAAEADVLFLDQPPPPTRPAPRPNAAPPPSYRPPAPKFAAPAPIDAAASCVPHYACGAVDECCVPAGGCASGLGLLGPSNDMLWGEAELLLWWRKEPTTPPLVTDGIGPGANVLIGADGLDRDAELGLRLTLGAWLDDSQTAGAFGRFYWLDDDPFRTQLIGMPGQVLVRPFIDADTGAPLGFNFVGPLGGATSIVSRSEVFGGDALVRRLLEEDGYSRLDLVFGYQFSRINEDLAIRSMTVLPPGLPNTLDIFDVFDVSNEFHGGAFGLQAHIDRDLWYADLLAKIGMGAMRETVQISGGGNPPATGLQGLLAQNSNIGEDTQTVFAVAPEVNLNVGCRLTNFLQASIGYSMIYWSHAVQPGNQIDPVVDVAPPLGGRPRFTFDGTDYWVMGLNFGLKASY
ncbi:MAG: BBP7 family outer membrane beta-barrel protein [Planctomycetes bacterium]|nr:BBP7 family outer membrane beta-barrel protein [Planctomycetota bacterium]